MTPSGFLRTVLDPGLALVAEIGGPPRSDFARVHLLAVAHIESTLLHRYQGAPGIVAGAARSFWQIEPGCITRLLAHETARHLLLAACTMCDVMPETVAIWRTVEGHDVLAAAVARILLWTDPYRLPHTKDEGWQCYLRTWNPGKPRADDWPDAWQIAHDEVADAA